jgi:hypothetical protein
LILPGVSININDPSQVRSRSWLALFGRELGTPPFIIFNVPRSTYLPFSLIFFFLFPKGLEQIFYVDTPPYVECEGKKIFILFYVLGRVGGIGRDRDVGDCFVTGMGG